MNESTSRGLRADLYIEKQKDLKKKSKAMGGKVTKEAENLDSDNELEFADGEESEL